MMKRLILCGIIASAVIGFIGMNAIMSSAENVPVFTQDQLQSGNVVVNAGDVFVVRAPMNESIRVNANQDKNLIAWRKGDFRYFLFQANTSHPVMQSIVIEY